MKAVITGHVCGLVRGEAPGRGSFIEVTVADLFGTIATIVVADREDSRAQFRLGAPVAVEMRIGE